MTSQYYGWKGEAFSTTGPLQDWSASGYAANTRPVPDNVPVGSNIMDFGAKGDGVADDTQALINAIASTPERTALLLPAGTYRITKQVKTHHQIVLRGAGKGVTKIYFPYSWQEAYQTGQVHPDGPYFIQFTSNGALNAGKLLTQLTGTARRGDFKLKVADSSQLRPGTWFMAEISGESGKMGVHMQGPGYDVPPGSKVPKLTRYINQVTAVAPGEVTLRFPLPYDIYDNPSMFAFDRIMTKAGPGVEYLTMEFPWSPYPGHRKEVGYNALVFSGCVNNHVRHVEIINADFGISSSSYFGSYYDVVMRTTKSRGDAVGSAGHHGIALWNGASFNVVDSCVFEDVYVHDITVSQFAVNNVIKNVKGVDVSFDHHRQVPYGNLFSNVDLGKGLRWLCSGGALAAGPAHAGSYNTYWNMKASAAEIPLPVGPRQVNAGNGLWSDFGGHCLNFIGPKFTREPRCDACVWNKEVVHDLSPHELHSAQLQHLGRLG